MSTNIHFFIISRLFHLRITNDSAKGCRQNQNTHFMFNNFFPKIVPFMRKCEKNIAQPDRPQMTKWRKRIACRIRKATKYTHSGCVILLGFPMQQLHKRASVLRCAYIGCLVLHTRGDRQNVIICVR
jgi:hypothetical protein